MEAPLSSQVTARMLPLDNPACMDLPFESGIFGKPVKRLQLSPDEEPRNLSSTLTALCSDWLSQGIWMVSCRLPEEWRTAAAELQASGFHRVETLTTMQRATANAPATTIEVSRAGPEDFEPCIEIGRTAFTFDRFHADPAIDDDLAAEIKARWVENGLRGRADAALVVRDQGTACGFILCLCSDEASTIDLIAVAPGFEGRGFGYALVAGALEHYSRRTATMRVGTQTNNLASIALYRSCGFSETMRSATFHWINSEMTS